MGVMSTLRLFVGASFMFGVAPEYFGLWAVWRGLSLVLPRWVYQWGDDKLYTLYQSLVLFFFETCTNVEVIMYGEAEEILKRRENVLYIANHQSTVDWIIANMVAIRANAIGHLRYVMKDSLKLIPLYGHYFYAHGCIYVKRGNFHQDRMVRSLEYLRTDKINTWLVIFPEGTRYIPTSPETIAKSERYAKENNIQTLKYHLSPKVRGTWLALEHLHEKFDAIYDCTVIYENTMDDSGVRRNAPQLAEFLKGVCPRIHIHVRRIPMHEVPKTEPKLKSWMHNVFLEKDKLIEPFFNPKAEIRQAAEKKLGGKRSQLSLWKTLPPFLFFSLLSIPLACTSFGQKLYIQVAVFGSLGSYGLLAIRSVC